MSVCKITEIKFAPELSEMEQIKSEYLATATAPLDGMWLCGFVPLAKHFRFYMDARAAGYCCINDEGYLLQFYLRDSCITECSSLLEDMVTGKYELLPKIHGAFVSTAEPGYLSLCVDYFETFKVNALMYQLGNKWTASSDNLHDRTLKPVQIDQLAETVEFGLRNLGAPEEWLTGYWTNLISRQELFGCWVDGELIGTGENRKFDDVQQGYTDVGVMVDEQQRSRGLATWILRELIQQAIELDLKPMCSTERDNTGAQKAISRAGFVARNRIVQFLV